VSSRHTAFVSNPVDPRHQVETSRDRRRWVLVAAAVAIGIAEPYVELAWKCRAGFEHSEACVWGRSFLSLGRWIAPLFVIPLALAVLFLLAAAWDWARRATKR
jgi:hypothetical protein